MRHPTERTSLPIDPWPWRRPSSATACCSGRQRRRTRARRCGRPPSPDKLRGPVRSPGTGAACENPAPRTSNVRCSAGISSSSARRSRSRHGRQPGAPGRMQRRGACGGKSPHTTGTTNTLKSVSAAAAELSVTVTSTLLPFCAYVTQYCRVPISASLTCACTRNASMWQT